MPRRFPRITVALVATTAFGAVAAGTVTAAAPAHASTSSEYTLITEPADNYQQIYTFIDSAKKTLDMTMYELVDTTAEQDLVADAARGVDVRVILDTNLEKSNNQAAYTYLTDNGVHVVWANTTYAATHQKTITVDGDESAIMTGNLTSRYYSTSRDFAVLDTNKVDVAAIEKVFNADYSHTSITPTDGDNLVWSPTDAETKLLGVINSATTSLSVENEEMSSSAIVSALCNAAENGVNVDVTMTANSDYDSEFTQLTDAGVSVHLYAEDAPLYIHAKVIVADAGQSDAQAYVGSINFSTASMTKNRELGFITTDSGIVNGLNSQLSSDFAGGTAYSS